MLIYLFVIVFLIFRLYLLVNIYPGADEIWTVFLTDYSYQEILTATLSDTIGPGYFLFIKAIFSVFRVEITLVNLRVISLFFAACGSWMIYRLSNYLYSKKTAQFALFLILILPSFIWISVNARYYSYLMFLSAATLFIFLKLLKKSSLTNILLFVFASLIGIYTHYYFLILVFVFALYLLTKRMLFKNEWKIVFTSISLAISPLLYYFFTFPKPRISVIQNNFFKIPGFFLSNLSSFQVLVYLNSIRLTIFNFLIVAGLALSGLYLFILGIRSIKGDYKKLFLLILFLPPVLLGIFSYYVRPALALNSLLIFCVPQIILIARGVSVNWRGNKLATIFFALILILSNIPFVKSFQSAKDFARPYYFVNKQTKPDDVSIHADLYTYLGAKYYLPNLAHLGVAPSIFNSQIESVHGYIIMAKDEIYKKDRIWYFEPVYFNIREARLFKKYLDENWEVKFSEKFSEANLVVYLYEKK